MIEVIILTKLISSTESRFWFAVEDIFQYKLYINESKGEIFVAKKKSLPAIYSINYKSSDGVET